MRATIAVVAVIPFYGVERPDLFAIERRAMDRPGRVIEALAAGLPRRGSVVDAGAGGGFTALRLMTLERVVYPAELSSAMIRRDRALPWIQAEAEHLPFADGTLDAAYATWAYFFSRGPAPEPGLRELHRVVRPGGPLLIVENLGGDESCALASEDITADLSFWDARGFACEVIETCFEFANSGEARTLLEFYFGERGAEGAAQRLSFRVGLFSSISRGPR
ncbi:MAG: class I SAM-dependent methyltransferase [Acidimicrobiia bacterium]